MSTIIEALKSANLDTTATCSGDYKDFAGYMFDYLEEHHPEIECPDGWTAPRAFIKWANGHVAGVGYSNFLSEEVIRKHIVKCLDAAGKKAQEDWDADPDACPDYKDAAAAVSDWLWDLYPGIDHPDGSACPRAFLAWCEEIREIRKEGGE